MFDRNFPFNQFNTEEIDGVKYRFIPNIWIRNEKLAAGATYEDYVSYMISDKPKINYHIAPSFVTNGRINNNGKAISGVDGKMGASYHGILGAVVLRIDHRR